MDFAAFDIDGALGTCGTEILASATTYAAILVDGGNEEGHGEFGVFAGGLGNHGYGSGRTMASAVSALDAIGVDDAIARKIDGHADVDGGLHGGGDGLDGTCGTNFATTGALGTAIAVFEAHLGLHEGAKILGGTEHLVGALADA